MSTTLRQRGGGVLQEPAPPPPRNQLPPYNGGIVCLLAVVAIAALLAAIAGALAYWRVTALDAKIGAMLPNITQLLDERQMVATMQETLDAFRKRQSAV